MIIRKKLEDEIMKKRKLIKDSEKNIENIPEYLRPTQEVVIKIHKRELEKLEEELMKLEKDSKDKISNV